MEISSLAMTVNPSTTQQVRKRETESLNDRKVNMKESVTKNEMNKAVKGMCGQPSETPRENNPSINQCPCCARPTKEHFGQTSNKRPAFAYLLRREIKQGKPEGRDWRTDPHPEDCIAVFNRAYFANSTPDKREPSHQEVVRVSDTRVFYVVDGEGPLRSCSRATWRRLDADLFSFAVGTA
jgi:hypothetical protein